jgi:hypothetical protein
MNRSFVKSISIGGALVCLATIGIATAAGPFDGQWNAHLFYNQAKCTKGDFPVKVADNQVSGEFKGIRGTYSLSGTVAPDGSFKGSLGRAPVTGKFSADMFEGLFPPPEAVCGEGHLQFERAK